MALILADRVRDTTTTTGTGTVTLSGTAPTGYQNFSVIGNGNTTYYTINAGSQWEVGIGTYSSTGPTLARNTVLESSNANALVNFSAGTKDVFVTYPSDEAVYQDGATIAAGTAVLGVTNGGTGVTTSTGTGSVVLSNSPTLVTPNLGTPSAVTLTNATGLPLTTGVTGTLGIANGGTNATTAAGARTSLGSTTLGDNLFIIPNPSAITFPRFNADNTVSALDAASFRTAIGAGTGGGSVTSVSGTGTVNGITLTGTVTSSGSLTLGGTLSGVDLATQTTGTLAVARGGTGLTSTPANGALDIGNGTGFTRATLTAGSGVSITNGAGSITIAATGSGGTVTSVNASGGTTGMTFSGGPVTGSGTLTLAGTLAVANGGTGVTTSTGTGSVVLSASPSFTGTVNFGPTITSGNGVSTGDVTFEHGGARTGNGNAIFDLHSIAGGDFQGRLIRYGGANGGMDLIQTGTGGMVISNEGSADTVFKTNALERMRITNAGNVGIGTSSPAQRLHVATTAAPSGTTQSFLRATADVGFGADFGGGIIQGVGPIATISTVSSGTATERMRIDSSGNVGIGTSSPGAKLDVSSSSFNIVASRSTGGYAAFQRIAPSGQQAYDFYTINGVEVARITADGANLLAFSTGSAAAERMRIDSSGNVGIGTTAPLARLFAQAPTGAGAAFSYIGNANGAYPSDVFGGSFGYNFSAGGAEVDFWNGWTGATGTQGGFAFRRQTGASSQNLLMTIQGDGNVGIGTSTPAQRLHVRQDQNGTTAALIQNRNGSGTPVSAVQFISGAFDLTDNRYAMISSAGGSNTTLQFWTGSGATPTERARINSSGEFLTGTTTGGRAVCMFASDMWLRLSNASRSWLIGPSIGSNFNIFDETGGYTVANFDTAGSFNLRNSIDIGNGVNLDNKIQIGAGRTGSNYAYIDLIGDTTYTDYGLRLIRGNGGANTTSQLVHRGTGDMYITTQDAATMYFQTNSTTRMYIEAGGTLQMNGALLVGRSSASTDVNTANDTGSFSVRGSSTTIASMSFHRTGAFAINMGLGTDNVFRIGGWSASSNAFQMDSGGNLTMLGNVTAYSDARIKKDVETIDSALDLVSKMRGVRYTRIDTKKRGVGVIAQEMLEVCPEVVQQGVGDDDTLSVAYGNLVGVLIEAVKELTARVAELEGK